MGVPNADDYLPCGGPSLATAFHALIGVLNQHRVRYAIIGGLAMIQHARVRTTDDIDALLILPQITMPAFFESLRDLGFDVSCSEIWDHGLTTVQFEDVLIDLMSPLSPVYGHVVEQAVESRILGHDVRVSSAEGLIVMKLIASRPLGESDVRDLLAAYPGQIDLDYVRNELDSAMAQDDPRRLKSESWVK